MSTGVHPYCLVRSLCVSLDYCCMIWKSAKIDGINVIEHVKKKIMGVFKKDVDLKYVYVPIFGEWSKMERLLTKLSSDRSFGGESQYNISWEYVIDTLFRDKSLSDIPQPVPSEFHELSFDTIKTMGFSKATKHVDFVTIQPVVSSKIDVFSLNNKLNHLKELVSSDKNPLKEVPEAIKTFDHPEISIDYDKVITYLSNMSTFDSHSTYLTDDQLFKKTVLVIKKTHNLSSMFTRPGENELYCVYWDVPFRLKIHHKLEKPVENILVFKNVWSVNEQLFSFYNSFMRDYCFHEEINESANTKKFFCKTDQTNNPKGDYMTSVDKRLGFRGSVNINGSLFLENMIADHISSRKIISQYNTSKVSTKIKLLGIGIHSIHFDMNIVSDQYDDKSYVPFGLSKDYHETNFSMGSKDDQKQENPFWKSNFLSKSNSIKNGKVNQLKPPFYFSVLWILDNLSDLSTVESVHLIIKDNRNQDAFMSYKNTNSESGIVNDNSNSSAYLNESSQSIPLKDEFINTSNISELQNFFVKYTNLSLDYFMYLLRRLLPFVKTNGDKKTFSSRIKLIYMKRSINSWATKIESILDEMLPYGEDGILNPRFFNIPFVYNDSRNYFRKNCQVLYNTLKKDKYKKDLFCGCFSLDKILINFGMVKPINTNTTDIYVDYDYDNLLKDCRDVIFIALEICRICRSDIQEILIGTKMTWFSRLCEYLCSVNHYPKPNILCNIKTDNITKQHNENLSSSSFLSKRSVFSREKSDSVIVDHENDSFTENVNGFLDDIKKSEVDNWKLKGGDISGSINSCHYINDDYEYNENGDNIFIGMVDFDAFYNSIICEYDLGYICYNPYAIKNGQKFYMSKELSETFNYLVNTRRELKIVKDKSESDIFRLNALKRVGNSFFGCVGMETSPIKSKTLSNLITYIGRVSVIYSREVASRLENTHILMSHTDSLCLKIAQRKISPLYKSHGYFDNDKVNTFQTAEKYLADVNSLISKNGFIKLLSENVYSCVHVINRTHYIAKKLVRGSNINYQSWIAETFSELESFLEKEGDHNYDRKTDIWSKIFFYQKELKYLLKKCFFGKFEKEFVVKGIFTKKWSIFRKFFFCILILSKFSDKSLHMNYQPIDSDFLHDELQENEQTKSLKSTLTTFLIFRIRNFIFRTLKSKNMLLLSGFVETVDGVIKNGFKNIFLTDSDQLCALKSDEYISVTILDLKKSKISVGKPWDSEKYNFVSNLEIVCKSGWVFDGSIPSTEDILSDFISPEKKFLDGVVIEPTDSVWYNSLFFDQILTDMNYHNKGHRTIFDIQFFDSKDMFDVSIPPIMLYILTTFEVNNLMDLVQLLKSFQNVDIQAEIENKRISFDGDSKKMTLNFSTEKNGNYVILHDMEIVFNSKIIYSMLSETKSEEYITFMNNLEHLYMFSDHVALHFGSEKIFFGKFISKKSEILIVSNNRKCHQILEEIRENFKDACLQTDTLNENDDCNKETQ